MLFSLSACSFLGPDLSRGPIDATLGDCGDSACAHVVAQGCNLPVQIPPQVARTINQSIEELVFSPVDELTGRVRRSEFVPHTEMILADLEPAPETAPYFLERTCELLDSGKGLLAVRVDIADFLGGVHPSKARYYRTFRLSDGALITWKDLLRDGTDKEIESIIRLHAIKFSDEPGETLATWSMHDDFALTKEGVLVAFQPYELASFAKSPLDVALKWEDVLPLLKARFLEELGKVG